MALRRRIAFFTLLSLLSVLAAVPVPAQAEDGGAHFYGSMGGTPLNAPVVGMAADKGTGDYWMVACDDEINAVRAGGNGGWDPVPGYDESTPMTDLSKFPDAMRPAWASGYPTIATSGGTFVTGGNGRSWSGALVVACLKGTQLRAFFLDSSNRVTSEEVILDMADRLRSPVVGPDGSLYVTTSNGSNDRILKVTPT